MADTLAQRFASCIIFFENGIIKEVLVGQDISKFSLLFAGADNNKDSDSRGGVVLKGQTAFGGKAQGTARIVFDPTDVKEFNNGDILIAPWTRPEFLPIMRNASAFVTDGGGILSHAAIVARELKKPCIIATKTATSVFKDGDLVEVDADNGVVRKLNRS